MAGLQTRERCEFDELISSVRTVAPESDYPDLYLGGQRLPALQAACHTQPPARPAARPAARPPAPHTRRMCRALPVFLL